MPKKLNLGDAPGRLDRSNGVTVGNPQCKRRSSKHNLANLDQQLDALSGPGKRLVLRLEPIVKRKHLIEAGRAERANPRFLKERRTDATTICFSRFGCRLGQLRNLLVQELNHSLREGPPSPALRVSSSKLRHQSLTFHHNDQAAGARDDRQLLHSLKEWVERLFLKRDDAG